MTSAADLRERHVREGYARGWSFAPMRGKRCFQKGWSTRPRETLDEALEWARTGNVAVRCGKHSGGLVVLDVDPGADVTGLDLPETVTVETGREGGRHFYFSCSVPLRNTNGELGPHVETKTTGALANYAGSVHSKTGRIYQWAPGLSPDDIPIAPLPEHLVERLRKSERNAPPMTPRGTGPDAYGRAALQKETEKVVHAAEGQRNAVLNEAAFACGQLVVGGHLQRADVEAELLAAAVSLGLPQREAAATIKSGLDAGAKEPRTARERPEPRKAGATTNEPTASTGAPPDLASVAPGIYLLSDTGNAERFVALHGSEFIWSTERGRWLRWDGRQWANDATMAAEKAAASVVRGLYAEAANAKDNDLRAATAKWAAASDRESRIKAVLELARPGLAVAMSGFDADPWALNVNNGVVNLRDGTLHDHDPAKWHTLLAPVDYDSGAECRRFAAFLSEIFAGDNELIGFVRRLVGVCLTGDISEHILPILYGVGANGKSCLLDTLIALLGDYAAQAPPGLLLAKHGEQHPTEIAYLAGKRLIAASEVDEGRKLRTSLVKSLTGDGKLCGRFMRRDFFTFDRTHKIILACNHRPVVTDTTHSMWRRLKLVPFTVVIPREKQDPRLPEKLLSEAPGILRWAVQGCLEWQREGLGPPQAVELATTAYRQDSDHVRTFADECCIRLPDARIAKAVVYGVYESWCKGQGEIPLHTGALTERLRGMGFEDKNARINGRTVKAWLGLEIVRSDQNE